MHVLFAGIFLVIFILCPSKVAVDWDKNVCLFLGLILVSMEMNPIKRRRRTFMAAH